MKYIKSFELLKEFRNIEPFKINFRDGLNVIVGENGCGKSTLFMLIMDPKCVKDTVKIDFIKGSNYKFLDTEKHNPRIRNLQELDEKFFSYGLMSHFTSHGETMFPFVNAVKDFKDIAVLIDELEAGLSLKNQIKISNTLKQVIKRNCQVIISTHSYIIMKEADVVFDMESKKWILSKDYLSTLLEDKK